MIGMRNGDGQDITAALTRYGITAAAIIAEAVEARSREIALIPGDEDNGITRPGAGIHNRADRLAQEGIACLDQQLLVGEVAGVTGTPAAAPMHVVALIGANPAVIGNGIVRQIGRELAEIHNVRHTSRVILHILIRNKGVVLALIKLVATGMSQQIAIAQR